MNPEIIRIELAKARIYLETKGIIKPIRKDPELSEPIIAEAKPDTLEAIEKRSETQEEFKENELGF